MTEKNVSTFDECVQMYLEHLYLIDEKVKRFKRMRNVWKGYRKRHKKKATKERDTFSQARNQRAELKSLNPYNAKRLQD